MSLKTVSVIILIFCVYMCAAEATDDLVESRKKHYHKVLYKNGLLYYLTFLAIKVKLVLGLGLIFAGIIFSGKIFALIKYIELKAHSDKTKEVYISPSYESHHHDFPSSPYFDEPSRRYSTLFRSNKNLDGYKRSMENFGIVEKIYKLLTRINLADTIFKEMKLEKVECRKKFVCETEWFARNSSMFKIIFRLMNDKVYETYKTKRRTSFEECQTLYPQCGSN